jgi:hypothetical protein
MFARHFEPRQMRRVHGDQPAQHAAGDDIADEMIVHRYKTQEHWSAEENGYDLYRSTVGHRNYPHHSEAQDSGSMT